MPNLSLKDILARCQSELEKAELDYKLKDKAWQDALHAGGLGEKPNQWEPRHKAQARRVALRDACELFDSLIKEGIN